MEYKEYYKIIDGVEVISDCQVIELDGVTISNPSEAQIYAAGWRDYVRPEPVHVPADAPDYEEVAQAMKVQMAPVLESLSDEQALPVAALYVTWVELLQAGKSVPAGTRCWDDGRLWKCKQAHVPQDDWRPEATPALWYEVSDDPWPAWKQPIDATEAYPQGAHVSHVEKHWESDVDNNVWEPGVYGWTEK